MQPHAAVAADSHWFVADSNVTGTLWNGQLRKVDAEGELTSSWSCELGGLTSLTTVEVGGVTRIAAGTTSGQVILLYPSMDADEVTALPPAHQQMVSAVAYQNSTLLSASWDQHLASYSLANDGSFLFTRSLHSHSKRVNAVCCGEGDTFVSGSSDETVKVWDQQLSVPRPAVTISTKAPVHSVTRCGFIVATGTEAGVSWYDLREAGTTLAQIPTTAAVECVSYSPDGELAVSTANGTVLVFEKDSTTAISTTKKYSDTSRVLAWNDSSKLFCGVWSSPNQGEIVSI
eukprot:TRINITY_DN12807_c0_g1_i1.p1 TRINITY_DN12807_c0_g1~~TRINITY_DN12807_c0_g1_i1.p1  ORF type:complete len:288 (-),score=29.81 TRINITY_DN12807_c0_g1_i1:686-1549(-)